MNKKGMGPIGVMILFMIFVIVWFAWLGGFVQTAGAMSSQAAGLTGIEAFFIERLNIVIFFAALLGAMAYMYFGAGQ